MLPETMSVEDIEKEAKEAAKVLRKKIPKKDLTNLQKVEEHIRKFLRLPEPPPVAEWARQNIRMPLKVSRMNSWWSLERNPYFAPILEFMRGRSTYLVLALGTQLGKTTLLFICILFNVIFRKHPVLCVYPAADDGAAVVRMRFKPLVEASPTIQEEVVKFNYDIQEFRGCNVRWVGSNAQSKLVSQPAGLVVIDEAKDVSTGNDELGNTGTIVQTMERIKDYPDGKFIMAGSPGRPDDVLWSWLEKSTFNMFQVQSPHAPDKYFYLDWEHIQFDDCYNERNVRDVKATLKTVWYKCPFTGLPITDKQKTSMIKSGRWVSQNPTADPDIVGFNMSSLYSMNISWVDMVKKYLALKDEPGGQAQFWNGWLAKYYTPKAQYINEEILRQRCVGLKDAEGNYIVKPYLRGDLMGNVRYLAADKQGTKYWYIVLGFDTVAKRVFVVDWGDQPTLNDLKGVYAKCQCSGGIVDVGFDKTSLTGEIYNANQTGQIWYGVQGFKELASGQNQTVKADDAFAGNTAGIKKGKYTYNLLSTNNAVWYEELCMLRNGERAGLFLPENADFLLFSHLMSVKMIQKKDAKGRVFIEYVEDESLNHLFDCLRYGLSFAEYARAYGSGASPMKAHKRQPWAKIF